MNRISVELQKLQECKNMSTRIEENQHELNDIRTTCKTLCGTEDILREKIHLKRHELEALTRDYANITDMYSRIINLALITFTS